MLIPPCPAGFLVISFQAFGHILMDHKADIRFINPHPKRVSGYNDPGMVTFPVFLFGRPLLHCQPGMVKISLETILIVKFGYFGGFLPAPYVNYTATFYP